MENKGEGVIPHFRLFNNTELNSLLIQISSLWGGLIAGRHGRVVVCLVCIREMDELLDEIKQCNLIMRTITCSRDACPLVSVNYIDKGNITPWRTECGITSKKLTFQI